MAAGGFMSGAKGGFISSPGGASSASATEEGSIEIATNAEVTTGSDTEKAITPSSLTSITKFGTVTAGTLSTGAVLGGVTTTLGSDATGDTYYRNAGGVLTRLAKGDDGEVLTLASGVPSWAASSGGASAGNQLQTVSTTELDLVTYAIGTWANDSWYQLAELDCAITVASTDNDVLIQPYVYCAGATFHHLVMFKIMVDLGSGVVDIDTLRASADSNADAQGQQRGVHVSRRDYDANGPPNPFAGAFLHSPATAAEITYSIHGYRAQSGSIFLNGAYAANTGAWMHKCMSSLTLTEIKG